MNIVLLSGGSGTRLWPLSNEVRSKQFLKIFKTQDGHESMIQRMYRMIKNRNAGASITIATSKNQIPQIKYQLGENVDISIEPCRRDTFPAIALACSYLKKKGVKEEDSIVVCPVDPYVEEDYFAMLEVLSDEAGKANLTLMGITPTYPSEKYGYILPDGEFVEKPTEEYAKKLICEGALWNSGIFAFKLKYLLEKADELLGSHDYEYLFYHYDSLKKISFDYAVAEHEKSIAVLPFSGEWRDLGTWNTLTEVMEEKISGNANAIDCEGTHIINELNIPLLSIGAEHMVITATPDGILVSDKDKSTLLKGYVEKSRPMHEARSWGHYTVLDSTAQTDGKNSLTKHLIISADRHISYQRHRQRTEIWTFIGGEGELIIEGQSRKVRMGDYVAIQAGTKHAIKALDKELHIIEVQIGENLTEEDIERFDWVWE